LLWGKEMRVIHRPFSTGGKLKIHSLRKNRSADKWFKWSGLQGASEAGKIVLDFTPLAP
jgi:hypothetical protein